MKKKSNILIIGLTGLLAILVYACNIDMPCQETTDVFLRAQLCRIDSTGKERVVKASVSIKAIDKDSLWYDQRANLSEIALPLKPNEETTSFEISLLLDTVWHHDVLSIHHENQDFFISMECGAIVKHRILGTEITSSDIIKEVLILNEEVNNKPDTHLKIYVE